MKNIVISICVLLAVSGYAHAETLYRWVDKEGKVHYGDKPAEDAIKTEQRKFSAPTSSGDDELSYTVRKAKQNFPVTLYVANSCGELCTQARSFLNKRGIPFAERNIATQAEVEDLQTKTGGKIVPAVTIGKTQISGFDAETWNGALDTAGYPKFAPYGSRPVPPPVLKTEPPAEAAP